MITGRDVCDWGGGQGSRSGRKGKSWGGLAEGKRR